MEFGVDAALVQRFAMSPGLDHAAAVHHVDHVGIDHCREPVGDDDGGAALHQGRERLLDLTFRIGVQRAGGLVQKQDRGVFEEGAGDGDALALATG